MQKEVMVELQRLLEEEQKAVTECRKSVAQWEKFRDDYETLKQRLTTLPDHMRYDVMVPIGKHAFMPGYLYHTNEITVLLGDNWFAQVTAKQAQDIIGRRQKVVEEKLTDANRQLKDAEAKLAFTTSFQQQDAVEIKEELTSDDSHPRNKKRIAHKKKMPSAVRATEKKEQVDDSELWKRLDELASQEEKESQQEGYEGEADNVTDHKMVATNIINISHTSLPMANIHSTSTHTPSGAIHSPADIIFCVNKPSTTADSTTHTEEPETKSKSVHWSSDVVTPPSPPPLEEPTGTSAVPKVNPFTGSIVEKAGQTVASSETGVRKVSKFKASRQT